MSRWRPNVTVAAVIERDGRFLLVEEEVDGRRVLNQPAGHLEAGESLLEAVVREVREETGCDFRPRALVGVYRWRDAQSDLTYLRFCFTGKAQERGEGHPRLEGIVALHWLSAAELRAARARHRSPLVLACVEDHLAGRHFPLAVLSQDYA